jgi:hypothetical protein
MTTTQTSSKKAENKSAKKKQQSSHHTDIGTPKIPVRQRKMNQQHEVLSDWNHAS